MFSANENLALRQHKRRIVSQIEECIPPDVLEQGTTVMVMQVSCRAPGCVPLETAVMILFPNSKKEEELMPGLKESGNGGTYKTKILKPMANVTKQDVLEALPPAFIGGLRSTEQLCYRARDVMLAQITQLMGEDDEEGRRLMAEYLQECLHDYVKRKCVAPDYGEPFEPLQGVCEEEKKTADEPVTTTATNHAEPSAASNKGNFLFRHDTGDDDMDRLPPLQAKITSNANTTAPKLTTAAASQTPSSMDWRRQQNIEKSFQSQSIISRLSEREHASGVRMAGCPCCDPDSPANYVDSMMML
jgi:hypothetical protein